MKASLDRFIVGVLATLFAAGVFTLTHSESAAPQAQIQDTTAAAYPEDAS